MKKVVKASLEYNDVETYGEDFEVIIVDVKNQQQDKEIVNLIQQLQSKNLLKSNVEVVGDVDESDYLYEYVRKFEDTIDPTDSDITFLAPEDLLYISEEEPKDDKLVYEDYEITWETVSPYFDKDFGNYLPDYQEYTEKFDVYVDFPGDCFYLTPEQFIEQAKELL